MVKLKLDTVSITDATMNKYLAAAGKTADQLNDADRVLMQIADSISGGNDDMSFYKYTLQCRICL